MPVASVLVPNVRLWKLESYHGQQHGARVLEDLCIVRYRRHNPYARG